MQDWQVDYCCVSSNVVVVPNSYSKEGCTSWLDLDQSDLKYEIEDISSEMSFLGQKGLIVEPMLLCVERSQLRWFGYLKRMLLGCLIWEVFWAYPTERRPWDRPRIMQVLYSISLLAWEFPRRSWRTWMGRKTYGFQVLSLLPPPDWWMARCTYSYKERIENYNVQKLWS